MAAVRRHLGHPVLLVLAAVVATVIVGLDTVAWAQDAPEEPGVSRRLPPSAAQATRLMGRQRDPLLDRQP